MGKLLFLIVIVFISSFLIYWVNFAYVNRFILYKGDKKIFFYIPKSYVEKQIEGDKLYVFIGLGYEKLFSFEHLYGTHWWEGTTGTYLIIENEKVIQSVTYIQVGKGDPVNNDKEIFPSNVFAEVDKNNINNFHLISEERDGKKLNTI